jgi:hypothetical protein
MTIYRKSKLLSLVSALFLSMCVFSPFASAETDPTYIAKNAINAYGSTLDKSLVDQLSKYQVVMMGEVHGTSEYPLFTLDLVKNLKAAGKKVTLALEIPANFQTTIEQAVTQKDLSVLAGSDFFQSKFQDGRESLAMALLIMAASEDANILCFDKDWNAAAKDRDLEMAKNVTRYAKKNPDRTIVLLAGNYHTRLEEHVSEPPFTPMGYYLSHVDTDPIDRSNIFSIIGRAEKGSNWACYSATPEECGVKRYKDGAPNYATAKDWTRYFLIEPTLQDGHDASIFIRSTSASVPLKGENSFLAECKISAQQLDLLVEQEFWTFDQTIFGHRYLFRPAALCKTTSAHLIDSYLLTQQSGLLPYQSRILYFHAGQDYAMANTYGVAIARFQNSFNKEEPADPELHWNAYVLATLAFLNKDNAALAEARAKFPDPSTGGDAINVKVVDRFLKCFESSYLDAYSGTGSCPK